VHLGHDPRLKLIQYSLPNYASLRLEHLLSDVTLIHKNDWHFLSNDFKNNEWHGMLIFHLLRRPVTEVMIVSDPLWQYTINIPTGRTPPTIPHPQGRGSPVDAISSAGHTCSPSPPSPD
jgi:hypothetical protein